jgi:NAD(P)-dependent dehydrogenase (short-subunit alcohol dehydrogenase family)
MPPQDPISDPSAATTSRRAALGIVGSLATAPLLALGTASAQGSGSAAQGDRTEPLGRPRGILQGKCAVVTGAARGIGRAIAEAFAAQGADVMGIDIAGPVSAISEAQPATRADLEETGRLVQQHGRRFLPWVGDVRDMANLRAAAAEAGKQFGKLDIVVADAAIQTMKPLLQMSDAEWRDVIDVNLNGYANTIRAFGPQLVAQRSGRIILVASRQGRQGWKYGSSYSASKWGVIGLMKSAALELAESGVTVNCVEPGLVDTALTRNPTRLHYALVETEHSQDVPKEPSLEQVAAQLARQSPMRIPWLQPRDIAPVVVFLASDEAHRVSGATYDVTAADGAHYTA